MRANLNQYKRLKGKSENTGCIEVHNLRIEAKSHRVFKNGEEIKLSNREFMLLLFLAQNPNIVFSKDQLFEKIWGLDYIGDNATVMVHIKRIREKIEENPSEPRFIETVWGAGYRFNV